MNGSSLMFHRIPRVMAFAFSVAFVVALLCATVVQAQTLTPAEDQYGDPTASLNAAGESSGVLGEGASADGSQATDPQVAEAQIVDPGVEGPQEGILPSTGGPLLLAYAGVLVASGAGVVLLRRRSS